jgi:protease IV
VRLTGTIVAGQSRREPLGDGGLAGAQTVSAALAEAASDARVKAIVLRIESPGGDAQASDFIWRAVVQARRRKPVVVSMGDLAASGGYLVAMGGEVLFAEPTTLTASIGAFALKPDLSGLLEKLSVNRDTVERGAVADVASVLKPWTAAERAQVEHAIDGIYSNFIDRVAEGRRLSRAEVEAVAGGRVFTGAQALERKLVDRLGGLAEAVAEARARAGLSDEGEVELVEEGAGLLDLPWPLSLAAERLAEPAVADPITRAAALVPEVRTAALLEELGPVLMLPTEWLSPTTP